MTVWDHVWEQFEIKEVLLKVSNDSTTFVSTILKSAKKLRKRGGFSQDTLNYLLVKDPEFARFYSLSKIHKRLYDVSERPVISNRSFYTKFFFHF